LNRLIIFLSFFAFVLSCKAQNSDNATIQLGAEQMTEYLPMLKRQKVALVVNQTSVINNTHLLDTLLKRHIKIVKIFAPEHGFRGNADAGESVKDGKDIKSGLPIVSLYGSNKKPTRDQLKGVDVIIFDIQDVGTRFYTYLSTMHYILEAAAENDKKVIVLDRPNPNGMYVDGPVLKETQRSFVGMHPIPIVHGMTFGELAHMINGEGWLHNGITCDLSVIRCKNYTHKYRYALPVKPSPNLPNDLAIALYPSLCLFEGTVISVGRGTQAPFTQIGHPLFKGMPHRFTPKSIDGMSKYPKYENQVCYGIKFQRAKHEFTLSYLIDFYNIYNGDEPYFNDYFNKLAGNETLQQQIMSGMTEEEIKATWQEDLNSFKAKRKRYLLYEDFE